MSEQKIKYPNPPIQEVVCEIHFDLPQPLTQKQLESLKPAWAETYPDQKVVTEKRVNVKISPEGINAVDQDLGYRLICRSPDGNRLVQLSGLFLVVNQLKPYPGWEESFREAIKLQSAVVQKTIGSLKFKRVGLRYINKIDIPEIPFIWENWFNFKLPVPALVGGHIGDFQMRFQQKLEQNCRLMINIRSLQSVLPSVSSVLLDLDAVWEGPSTESELLPDILEKVHGPHRFAFEAYLSDRLRKLFG